MTANTGATPEQMLKLINRFTSLSTNALGLIHRKVRDQSEIDKLVLAMQLFKENRLGAVIPKLESTPTLAELQPSFSTLVEDTELSSEWKSYFRRRGVRYVGEVYLCRFFAGSKYSEQTEKEVKESLKGQYGIPKNCHPLQMGWQPPYWQDPGFVAELNKPLPEVFNTAGQKVPAYYPLFKAGIYFAGQYLANQRRCPAAPYRRGQENDGWTVGSLKNKQSCLTTDQVWAAAVLPPNWHTPAITSEILALEKDCEQRIKDIRASEKKWRAKMAAEAELLRQKQESEAIEKLRHIDAIRKKEGQNPDVLAIGRLDITIDDLELSVRAYHSLRNADLRQVGQIIQCSESELLRTKNFGRKSLKEIKDLLCELGLCLDQPLPPPLADRYPIPVMIKSPRTF